MKTTPVLTPRLQTAVDMLGQCNCLADIGTDHAYLPIYMKIKGLCVSAIASDIGQGPLNRAASTAKKYGTDVSLRLGAGLDTLADNEADAVVIAGMGGLLIADIIKNGADKLKRTKKIILQPMSSIPELRAYLIKNGWQITEERIAKEENKLYILMSVVPPCLANTNKCEVYTECDFFIGKCLIETKPRYFDELLTRSQKKLQGIVNGLKSSDSEETKVKLEKCENLLKEINDLI